MDLTEQADASVNDRFIEVGASYRSEIHAAARLIWLDGFKAGADATKQLADEAFEKLERAL